MTTAYFEGKKYTTCKDLRKAVFEWCIEKDIILPSGSSIVNLWKHWKITNKYIDVLSRIDIVDDRGEFRPDRIRMSLMTNSLTIQARCIDILISITEETLSVFEKRTSICIFSILDLIQAK